MRMHSCRMVTCNPNHLFSTFYIAFYIFITGGHRNFKFGRAVDHSKL